MSIDRATGEIVEPLTAMEKSDFTHAEAEIETGVSLVGKALARIREFRLYRESFSSFETYCQTRWNMTHRTADRKIAAAEVAEMLGPIGPIPESQARELSPLRDQPSVVRDIYQDVQRQTSGKPTARAIRDTVQRHLAAVPAPVQDEEFWNDAAEKATASGWVAKRDAERPYSMAVVRLTRVASDITGIEIDPKILAANLPEHLVGSLNDIQSAADWLNTFLAAHKESE